MKRTATIGLFLVAALGVGQSAIPGVDHPMTMKPTELTSDYRPLKLKEQSSGIFGDYYSSSYFQFGSIGLRGDDPRMVELTEVLPVSWTKNETAEVYGQKFLVTYIFEPSVEDIRAFAEGKPMSHVMLKLKLLKTDQIGSIEPFPDLDLPKYLAFMESLTQSGTATFSNAKRAQALTNAKQVGLAANMYLTDNNDIFPYVQSTASLMKLVHPYLKNGEVWKSHNPTGEGRFLFNMSLAGVNATDVAEPANVPMFYDPNPYPDGTRLVSFVDSHASFVDAERWKKIEKFLKLKLKRHGKPIKA